MRLIQKIGQWFDLRLQLGGPIRETAEHQVPRETASWFYVFGSAALTCFMLQIVTSILLALIYVPSAEEAWNSLQTLNHGVSLGWFIRALHGWGSNFMVAIVLIHMAQVFLFGAYKFPRELTWIVGVFLAFCAVHFGTFGLSGQPDPTIIQTAPRPDFFFLWLYALLSFLPPSAETPILLIGPAIGIIFLVALPFIAGEGEKSWKRRPTAVLTILLVAVALGTLTHLAQHTPWSPVMDAWSRVPIPGEFLNGRTALERHGALVFQVKQCHNCHSLDDQGGHRGPALDAVALRLTEDQLIRQVIQGGGNMPAYGKNLSPAETTALVAFLETLHPQNRKPARNASQAVALGTREASSR
jgi:quinol-cytochrome oxidoreductase complex cytochrome b subunit